VLKIESTRLLAIDAAVEGIDAIGCHCSPVSLSKLLLASDLKACEKWSLKTRHCPGPPLSSILDVLLAVRLTRKLQF
jgi:hypothetical protein